MTRNDALALLKCSSSLELAQKLNISPAAVSQWNEDAIPLLREFQINKLYDETIKNSSSSENIQN